MRPSSLISAAAKPFFDRYSEALKVAGAGNSAGLVAMATALHTVPSDHTHTVLLLKPTAVIFGLGVILFGLAYLFLVYAYIYSEHYGALLDQNAPAEPSKEASLHFMKRTGYVGLASAFCFFVGFVITLTALIRY
jgi:hypothetical protein